jgi:hydroxyacylglutathione hydrolase
VTARLVEVIPVGPLACNCSIVVDEATRQAVVIDPGGEASRILAALERNGARAVTLLHTHAHFDHIAATAEVHRETAASIRLHPEDDFLYGMLVRQGAMFGFHFEEPDPVTAPLSDGEAIGFGASSVRTIHTPGHSPGSTCFLLSGPAPVLFTGDTLFRDSIGRTDLWGGSFPAIERSIREKLYVLPEDLRVMPGHGEETTIGREKSGNPFVRGTEI